jgi:hypothetical protein
LPQKLLPPLEVGTPYLVADYESVEFWAPRLTGQSTAILRVHLKNGTTLDLPTSETDLQHLMAMLIEAYGTKAIEHLKSRRWI